MDREFDSQKAKDNLIRKEQQEQEQNENKRLALLEQTKIVLKKEFSESEVEVYLIGSILKPNSFSERSDIDVVIKNFKGDRFELWAKIERELNHKIEIVLYEKCSFREHVEKEGLRIV